MHQFKCCRSSTMAQKYDLYFFNVNGQTKYYFILLAISHFMSLFIYCKNNYNTYIIGAYNLLFKNHHEVLRCMTILSDQ